MKPSYVRYVLGLITVLLFAVNCDCQKDPIDPQHYWVVCSDTAAALMGVPGTGGTPALTNGKDVKLSGQLSTHRNGVVQILAARRSGRAQESLFTKHLPSKHPERGSKQEL